MTFARKSEKTVYSIVTERIIKQMESGRIPWKQPWDYATPKDNGFLAKNAVTGRVYSMSNQMLLGFKGGRYIGWKQLKDRGGELKENATPEIVTFWTKKEYKRTDTNGNPVLSEDGEEQIYTRWILKYHTVYNINDTTLELEDVKAPARENIGISGADEVINGYVKHEHIAFDNTGSNKAFYRPSADSVTVPNINQFKEVAEYYSTTFHELTHSTGHPSRLDRLESTFFGSSEYAKEELVAELGSAFSLATLEIENKQTEQNSVAYLQGWIEACKKDDHLIVSAATMAEKAVNYIFDSADAYEEVEEDLSEEEVEELESEEEESGFVEFKVENASFKLNPVGVMRSMALKDFNKMLKYIKAYEKTRNQNLNLLINAGQNLKRTTFKKKEVETLDKKMKYIMA